MELVVADVVVEVAVGINIHVVAPESITERGAGETAGMDGDFTARHHSSTQSQRDVGINRNGCLQRNVEAQLYRGIFLCVEAHAGM